MALTQLTKIDGGGISTTSDYRVGVITASKFVGPFDGTGGNFSGVVTATNGVFSGNISAVDGNFSGNVTIGGTLTYEDVTNIDSVGIITAQKDIHVGAGVSVVGIVTAATGDFFDLDVDGHTNLDNVSVAGVTTFANKVTAAAGPNKGIQVGSNLKLTDQANVFIQNTANSTMYLMSKGTQIRDRSNNNLASFSETGGSGLFHHSGSSIKLVTTATGISIPEDLDVDGHTNLDNVSVAGVSTFADRVTISGGKDLFMFDNGVIRLGDNSNTSDFQMFHNGHTRLNNASGSLYIQNTSTGGAVAISAKSGQNGILVREAPVILYYDNTLRFSTSGVGATVYGNLDVTADLDVDGHTNLDNVSVAGVSTFTGQLNANVVEVNSTINVIGESTFRDRIQLVDSAPEILLSVPSGGLDSRILNDGSGNLIIGHGINSDTPTERLRITSTGEVRIPTGSNSTSRLTFGGGVNIYHDNNFKIENATGYLKLQSSNNLYIDGAELFFRNAGGTNRWKIDSSGHFVPGTAGAVNIGSATAEIGDVFLADDKSVQVGNSQDLKIFHDSSATNNVIEGHTGSLNLRNYNVNSTNIVLSARNHILLQTNLNETAIQCLANGATEIFHDGGATPKLRTTTTGIQALGEVAASQDYPDFEPVLNFNFAGSSTQLDPRLLYRRSGVASFYDANGLVKLVGENTPRFDHDPISRKNKGILIEHSRTNLFPYGTTPGDLWSSSKSGTFEENTTETTAPDGTFTATKWTFTNNDPYIYHAQTLSANTTYTISMWVKAGTNMAGDRLQMRIGGAPYSSGDAEIIPADGTWRRVTYTRTIGGSAENSANVGFEPQTSPSGNPASGDVIYIWGAQLEVGAYVSSFIPTYGRTQTRGNDLLVIDGDDSTALSDAYNDQEGTLVVEYHNVITDGSYVATIDDGSNNNRFGISNSNSSQGISVSGGTSQGQLDNGTPIVGATNKMAHAYKLNDRGLSLNGNDATQDNGFALPTGIRFIWIGCRSGSYDFLGSTISRFMYYTKRLPNSQLKLLTSQ